MYRVLDTVVLERDLPDHGLRKWDLGAVVEVYEPDGIEVEFVTASEGERAALVVDYHRRAQVKLANHRLHATIHVIVESQVAMGNDLPVRRALERLQAEGLDRHEAIHAIGSVLASHVYDLMKTGAPQMDPNEAYWGELESLRAEGWRRAHSQLRNPGADALRPRAGSRRTRRAAA